MHRRNHREKVLRRDKGVCELCEIDCVRLKERIVEMKSLGVPDAEINEAFAVHGFHEAVHASLWEADHIIPLSEGGGDHPRNIRTLCQSCHKKETALLKARLARRVSKVAKEYCEEGSHKWKIYRKPNGHGLKCEKCGSKKPYRR